MAGWRSSVMQLVAPPAKTPLLTLQPTGDPHKMAAGDADVLPFSVPRSPTGALSANSLTLTPRTSLSGSRSFICCPYGAFYIVT